MSNILVGTILYNGPNRPVLTGIGLNYLAKTGGEWWRPVPTCFVGLVKSALIELKEGIPIVQRLNKTDGFFSHAGFSLLLALVKFSIHR